METLFKLIRNLSSKQIYKYYPSRGISIEVRTQAALEQAYIALQEIVTNLYDQVERAINVDNYADASLLQSQADHLYQVAENLGILIAEIK